MVTNLWTRGKLKYILQYDKLYSQTIRIYLKGYKLSIEIYRIKYFYPKVERKNAITFLVLFLKMIFQRLLSALLSLATKVSY